MFHEGNYSVQAAAVNMDGKSVFCVNGSYEDLGLGVRVGQQRERIGWAVGMAK